MRLLQAIRFCYENKYVTLDVKRHGTWAEWNPGEDAGWQMYYEYRNYIASHKILDKALCRIGVI